MRSYARPDRSPKRPPKPLDRARLEELALAYVARFATSAAKLETYLKRKLRERGWEGEDEPGVAALAARYAELGYVDDEGYARARSGGLLRRGYGPRRVNQALVAAGIDEEIRQAVRADAGQEREAALAMARKRKFGPFGEERPDRARREKQLSAMLRAGHALDSARELVDAASIEAAEEWAASAEEDILGMKRHFLIALVAVLAACSPQEQASAGSPAVAVSRHPESGLEVIPLTVTNVDGKVHKFRVEVAATEEDQAKGLMFRKAMGADEGMIFPRNPPDFASFWMHNTVIPLDIIFVGTDHKIINISADAVPYSENPRPSMGLALGVLELNGGRAAQLGIGPGAKVEW